MTTSTTTPHRLSIAPVAARTYWSLPKPQRDAFHARAAAVTANPDAGAPLPGGDYTTRFGTNGSFRYSVAGPVVIVTAITVHPL